MVITSQCIRGGSSTQPLVVNCKWDANCCKKPPVITGSNLWLSVHLPGINSKMVLSHTIWLNASYFSRNEIDSWQTTASRGTEKTWYPGTDQNIGELIEKPTNLYLLSPIASVNNQCSTELPMLCTFRIFVAISLIFHWQTTQNNHG